MASHKINHFTIFNNLSILSTSEVLIIPLQMSQLTVVICFMKILAYANYILS